MAHLQFQAEMLKCAQCPELHKLVDACQTIANALPKNTEVYRSNDPSTYTLNMKYMVNKVIDGVFSNLLHIYNNVESRCSQMNTMQVVSTLSMTYAAYRLIVHIERNGKDYKTCILQISTYILRSIRLISTAPIYGIQYVPRVISLTYCLFFIAHHANIQLEIPELIVLVLETLNQYGIDQDKINTFIKTVNIAYDAVPTDIRVMPTGLITIQECQSGTTTNDDSLQSSYVDIGVAFFMFGALHSAYKNKQLECNTNMLQKTLTEAQTELESQAQISSEATVKITELQAENKEILMLLNKHTASAEAELVQFGKE